MSDKKRSLEEANAGDEQAPQQTSVATAEEPKTTEAEEQAAKKTKTESETTTEPSTTATAAPETTTTETVSKSSEATPTTATTEENKSNGDGKTEDKATSTPWTFKAFASNPDPSKPFTSPFSFSSFASSSASPFSFNLNTTTSFTNGFSKAASTDTDGNKDASSESTDGAIADGEDYSKSATYVPILQNLQPVQTMTGEEDEKTICSAKGKLYIFNETYKERGVGMLKLNRNPTTGNSRLLLNIDGSKRSALNVAIFASMSVDLPTEKSLRFTAFEDGKFHSFLINMKKPEEITMFETNIKKQIALLKERQPAPAAAAAADDKKETAPAATTNATETTTPSKEETKTAAE